jgi:hypothetical protein
MLNERIVPLTEDLTKPTAVGLDIIRDLERAMAAVQDFAINTGDEFQEGDWARLSSDGLAVEVVTGAVGATDMLYPVWCGNADRYDAVATQQVTVITCQDWIYKTSRFNPLGSYVVGTELTVKNGKVPTPAGAGEPIVGVVVQPIDTDGYLTIQVRRGVKA